MVNVTDIKPIHDTRVPKGKADPLYKGTFRIGDPVTIKNRQETRIIEEM